MKRETKNFDYDGEGTEVYDGDEIEIDFDKAAQAIKGGFMVANIKTSKPTKDAKLKVEYSDFRYRLVWRTHNGGVDTGIDWALISSIKPFVKVVKEAALSDAG